MAQRLISRRLSLLPYLTRPSILITFSTSLCTSINQHEQEFPVPSTNLNPLLLQNIQTVVSSLRDFTSRSTIDKQQLEACDVAISQELVSECLARLRNEWESAFTFFLWAGKKPGYAHSVREYHCMIAILGNFRKFDSAWSVIEEMRVKGLVKPHTILILIRRYCAIHDVASAINAFYTLKRFGFAPAMEEFQGLLSALCRYKNTQDAEHLLLSNQSTFHFNTKSFNIVLNGWCNVMVNLRESKRFWRNMDLRGIKKDIFSYSSMISCFSKAGNLNDVLKLFDEMKKNEIRPDIKVYNAIIFALAKGKCIEEAKSMMKKMQENGLKPDSVTYNSLIRPLCKARKIEDAYKLFDEMSERKISPSLRTFHSFFDISRNSEEVFEILNKMNEMDCKPAMETYIMLIRKFCRWKKIECVLKLWHEIMPKYGYSPDKSVYISLINGLFLSGKLEEALRYYKEMKIKGFSPEPKTEEMIQAYINGKEVASKPKLGHMIRDRGFVIYQR